MKVIDDLALMLGVARAHGIVRRYMVTNGLDTALAMLGLTLGVRAESGLMPSTVLGACIGTAIALGVSGWSSTFLSESAERRRELRDLEEAMAVRMGDSLHGRAARWVPWMVASASGLSPVIVGLFVVTPLWLAERGIVLPFSVQPIEASALAAVVVTLLLGIFLGRLSGVFWLWSVLRTLLIAAITAALIFLFGL